MGVNWKFLICLFYQCANISLCLSGRTIQAHGVFSDKKRRAFGVGKKVKNNNL